MTTEQQQFYSDALFQNRSQSILDFGQKNPQIIRVDDSLTLSNYLQ